VILLLDGGTEDWWAVTVGTAGMFKAYVPIGQSGDIAGMTREFSSSEYSRTIRGIVAGTPPAVDLAAEKRLIALLAALASEGALQSAHDVSDGGLAVTLAESCFASDGLSAQISLASTEPDEAALFGERGARAIVSVTSANLAPVRSLAAQYGVAALEVGRVARGDFRIELNGRVVVSADVPPIADAWSGAIEGLLRDIDFRKAE
jgi:phosphoribosylformylglycinamidine synthase subunit PurL